MKLAMDPPDTERPVASSPGKPILDTSQPMSDFSTMSQLAPARLPPTWGLKAPMMRSATQDTGSTVDGMKLKNFGCCVVTRDSNIKAHSSSTCEIEVAFPGTARPLIMSFSFRVGCVDMASGFNRSAPPETARVCLHEMPHSPIVGFGP